MSLGAKAILRLRVVPNARRSEVVGVHGDAIKVKIQAPAVEGKANEALRDFLAERLQVPARAVEIISGGKSRDKVVAVEGLETVEARNRLLGGN
ncbi:MAG: DUF167 domain-containing protein [Chthoniobacter sp.]|uniref:DUF167 domain-containing protein n=1 Tax=Chthoniobacter sp. TaxID=2510640 RepID=UPI0032A7551D